MADFKIDRKGRVRINPEVLRRESFGGERTIFSDMDLRPARTLMVDVPTLGISAVFRRIKTGFWY